ncbi:hypothetical protein CWI37_0486p0010 [Hamiltosporidium tvaerminnensis]|uniref:peptidyl-tRNA hydrolase n=1 Tax=Hamiltosporidium tvaerminnensis TaxID=1176355 RepID=A0A4Q9L6E1_9MICR|nr:hypothetical protein CWI37_0486p0010 [Hamiltosporidium tvaerminnensis]
MITQYILLRNDLKNFSKGALIAQACHASVSAIITYKNDLDNQLYISDLNNMTKVILKVFYS